MDSDAAHRHFYIPPQVVFEFVTSRESTLAKAIDSYEHGLKVIEGVSTLLDGQPEHVFEPLREQWKGATKGIVEKFAKKVRDSRDEVAIRNRKDTLVEGLAEFFDETGRIAPTSEELSWIAENGNSRYKRNVPPGFKDKDKGTSDTDEDPTKFYEYGADNIRMPQGFGDLLIWRQVLGHAQRLGEEGRRVEHLIFITDDDKVDWWWKTTRGRTAHPLLAQESSALGLQLWLVDSGQFLELGKASYGIAVSKQDLEQVQTTVRQKQREQLPLATETVNGVTFLTPNMEKGIASIRIMREVPYATGTFSLNFDPGDHPSIDVWSEDTHIGVASRGGVSHGNKLNIHFRLDSREPIPCGVYNFGYSVSAAEEE